MWMHKDLKLSPSIDRRVFLTTGTAFGIFGTQAQAASSDIGLIFAAQSTCPYCRYLAPIMGTLQAQGMDVLYASMDRQPLAPFSQFEDGLTHPLTSGLTSVPNIFVVNTRLGRVTHQLDGFKTPRHFILRLTAAIQQSVAL